MQNLFVAIAEKKNRVAGAHNLTGYIFAMAKNQAMDFLRSEPKNEKNIEDYKNIITVRDNTTYDIWRYCASIKCFFKYCR